MATLPTRHEDQLPAQLLGIPDQFRIAEFIAGNGKEKAEHIAKIVIHKRGHYAGWKLSGGITHPATQFIPDLRQRI